MPAPIIVYFCVSLASSCCVAFVPSASNLRNTLLHAKDQTSKSLLSKLYALRGGSIELGGVLYDNTDMAFNAWEWTNALSAP